MEKQQEEIVTGLKAAGKLLGLSRNQMRIWHAQGRLPDPINVMSLGGNKVLRQWTLQQLEICRKAAIEEKQQRRLSLRNLRRTPLC